MEPQSSVLGTHQTQSIHLRVAKAYKAQIQAHPRMNAAHNLFFNFSHFVKVTF